MVINYAFLMLIYEAEKYDGELDVRDSEGIRRRYVFQTPSRIVQYVSDDGGE